MRRAVRSSEPDAPGGGARASAPSLEVRQSLVWGISGFVIGAAFWHVVGFWGFIERIVYSGHPDDGVRYVAQSGLECTELVLDRGSRRVASGICPLEAPLLDERSESARGDFLGPRTPLARSHRHLRLSFGED